MNELEQIEIDLLIRAIFQRYGYDFREYSVPSLHRRINTSLGKMGYKSISAIIPDILRDYDLFENFLNNISVTVTEMFRNPRVYRIIREKVVPLLKSFPRLNIWHAGCATGEEVYSFAILLKEEGLYDRAMIYATDINPLAIKKAKEGIFSIDSVQEGTRNYKESGGRCSFTDYYYARYGRVMMDVSLKKNITFMTHNLVNDKIFNEMHFLFCRNVLIYFNHKLQNKILRLFSDSLIYNGILCLGTKEGISFSDVGKDFVVISEEERLFQKKVLGGI